MCTSFRSGAAALGLFLVSSAQTDAQSFFADFGTDPATGVDRGSASQIQPVERTTTFVTLSSDGAQDIGPWIGSISLSLPMLSGAQDQLDMLAVIGGPSADGGRELGAVGLGYRVAPEDTGITFFANADISDFRLGRANLLPLEIEGRIVNAAIGVQGRLEFGPFQRLTTTLEMSGREERVESLGVRLTDESLRVLRGSVRYEDGAPYSVRRRFAVSVSRGLSGLGASSDTNPLASSPGVQTDFLRVAASAEVSVPVSRRLLFNGGVIAQWSADSLPVSQRCGYGTNAYARGFDRKYVNGDRCLGARIELAYDIDRPVPGAQPIRATQTFAGLDGGRVRDNANAVAGASGDTWSSLSLGVRAIWGNVLTEVSATQILDQPVGAFEQDHTRVWLRMAVRF